jgi:phosphohistidine phosphatase
MHELNLKLDLILSSPLTRALQTAELVASRMGLEEHLRTDERLAFGFGVGALSALLGELESEVAVMLVGHEPSFSSTVSGITGGGRIVFKKGALARVDLAQLNPPQGQLMWLIPPKVLVG